jgi:hypothetical protein
MYNKTEKTGEEAIQPVWSKQEKTMKNLREQLTPQPRINPGTF